MLLINKPNGNYTARQLKLPLEIEKLINISDPVYTFCEVMNHGFCSLREIEKLCRTDIRYMYLLDEMKAPSFATFGNFIRNELTDTIEQIFADANTLDNHMFSLCYGLSPRMTGTSHPRTALLTHQLHRR